MNKDTVIKELGLEPNGEGGHIGHTYTSPWTIKIPKDDGTRPERPLMTSIYYMVPEDSPIAHFHRNNTSDVVNYFHMGLSLRYYLLTPEGKISSVVLGPNVTAGERPQITVKAGIWKATELVPCKDSHYDFGMLSESVVPGFESADWSAATKEQIIDLLPDTWKTYRRFIACKDDD